METKTQSEKIYKEKAIAGGTYFGGPLVAGYFMAQNFKVFNEPEKAKKAWIYSILFTIFLFGSLFLIPDIEKVPRYIIPLFYVGIVYVLINKYQIENINAHLSNGGSFYPWWRVAVISLIGVVITLATIIGIAFIYEGVTSMNTSHKTYGPVKNEISYETGNLTDTELNKLADAFKQAAFFDDVEKRFVFVKKANTNYEIYITISKGAIDIPELADAFKQLKNDIQPHFPQNKIIIKLIEGTLDNVVKTIE